MESLLHAGRSITSSLVLQDVLDAVAREVVDTFGASYCVIWEYAEDEDALLERAGFGVERWLHASTTTCCCWRSGPGARDPLQPRAGARDPVRPGAGRAEPRSPWSEWGEKTCLSLPLRFGEVTLGVLVICETERERRFTSEELDLAMGLANQASAAVHNARVFHDLQRRNVELEARGPGRSGC